jgi:hypothetical protein
VSPPPSLSCGWRLLDRHSRYSSARCPWLIKKSREAAKAVRRRGLGGGGWDAALLNSLAKWRGWRRTRWCCCWEGGGVDGRRARAGGVAWHSESDTMALSLLRAPSSFLRGPFLSYAAACACAVSVLLCVVSVRLLMVYCRVVNSCVRETVRVRAVPLCRCPVGRLSLSVSRVCVQAHLEHLECRLQRVTGVCSRSAPVRSEHRISEHATSRDVAIFLQIQYSAQSIPLHRSRIRYARRYLQLFRHSFACVSDRRPCVSCSTNRKPGLSSACLCARTH